MFKTTIYEELTLNNQVMSVHKCQGLSAVIDHKRSTFIDSTITDLSSRNIQLECLVIEGVAIVRNVNGKCRRCPFQYLLFRSGRSFNVNPAYAVYFILQCLTSVTW